MVAFSLSPVTLEIADGDIAHQPTDAVVNAANNELWMGAGVAGAIKAAGGREIEAEAMAQGPVPLGECVVTSFGRLPRPRFVIHAVVMGQDRRTSGALIRTATRNALKAAEQLRVASIAFPALGTGVGGFPMGDCARAMIGGMRDHLSGASTLRQIRVVLFGQTACRAYAEAAAGILGPPLDGPADCPISS